MIRWFLRLLTRHVLGRPRIIFGGTGCEPYLSRWFLLPWKRPTMPDGSEPFDQFGDTREGVRWPEGWNIYLHCFHRSDEDRELHNHPWQWARSVILAGGYLEERRTPQGGVAIRGYLPFSTNSISADTFHRVELLEQDCWSLILVGPKVGTWGFWDRFSRAFVPWRQFLERKRGASA